MNAEDAYRQLAISSTKQQIKNILKSYVGYFDPFCELLQNAMDATDKRQQNCGEPLYSKKIRVIINLYENSIYVADNGIGFESTQFRAFLSPNVTYKNEGHTRGNKGVGTTYLAYGFNKMEIYTKTPTFTQYAVINDARNWIEDKSGNVNMPLVEPMVENDPTFPFDQGSSFKLYFTDSQGCKIKDLGWIGVSTAESWNYVLLSNTPLGHLTIDGSKSHVTYDLSVINTNEKETNLTNQEASYFYPHLFLKNGSVDIADVIAWQKSEIDKGRDGANIPQRFNKKFSLYKFFSTEDISVLANRSKTLTQEEQSMLSEYSISAYGFFCNSVDRWSDINEKVIGARKGANCITYGLQLATDDMIQGSPMQIPLTSNIGYQKQSQVIVHFNGAEPDLGRKGFQPELRILAEKISSMIVSLGLSGWKRLLAADGNYNRRDNDVKALHDYIREMETHEKEQPLLINNEAFFLPTKQISISSVPMSEQDVVVLFNQLIAGGVIRSLELMAASTYVKYDGIFKIKVREPLENHYFNEQNNPLGVDREAPIQPGIQTAPAFLEYKYSFDALIQDFDNEDKHPKDLGLVVVWTMGKGRWKERFQAISYLLPDYRNRRPYHGLTHEMFDGASSNQRVFYCIVLEELIQYLNDPQKYYDEYSAQYSED
ncbi:MAG: hypothetical protein VB064_01920 [Oscillospiraceae bacterium]|nr:hypothetical protein [Oscillospiraceae bacterium]